MNMANGAVKLGNQNVEFSTFNIRRGTVVHMIDTVLNVLLENVNTTRVLGAPVFSFNTYANVTHRKHVVFRAWTVN